MEREEIIERLIKEQGLSLRAFAEKCGIPYTSFYTILNRTGIGRTSVDVVITICKNLGITVDDLERMVNENKSSFEPTYEDVEQLVARNGKKMSVEQKMRLIKLLSENE
ncbi:helix-turn-helix transcriptional regulator [[Clostridium] symbiosum]|uniref:helix-turn-helix domain-containing protein n=1 Tax=Clostridium symbiosum TaxID=1512 RepID=UPI001D084194|nr:helix-turn-helix transcriptional regulator [[Clostridium] symbiosum]MCB6610228.1 helix-turn-helix domain-containing protein [[Clostridium] symbiosum]MCB6933563.1 helix-turn-helix domain-containing protein [[Clostridium] symbiosum]